MLPPAPDAARLRPMFRFLRSLPATCATLIYTGISLAMMWVLPLFPAEPMLAPILRPVTHMVAPEFPLLLFAPAIVIDLLLRRHSAPGEAPERASADWRIAAAGGVAFVGIFGVDPVGVRRLHALGRGAELLVPGQHVGLHGRARQLGERVLARRPVPRGRVLRLAFPVRRVVGAADRVRLGPLGPVAGELVAARPPGRPGGVAPAD